MKILVTGGAGFIGKHLVRSLLEKGYLITIFDNFSNSTKDSISHIVNIGAKVIEGDITRPNEISNAVKGQDVVIHLAAKISVSESIINPAEIFQVNVNGTRNVLDACDKNQIKKLIVASSAAVYGEGPPNVKLTEESETNPISPYGESKLKMEQDIAEFTSKHNINYIILRFFNIFGVGQSKEYAGVISKFIEKIRQDRPLEIFGDGMQTRDFVAIEDVINSIHNAISHSKSGTYNIASGKVVTIKELAEMILSISGKKLEIRHTTPKKGDIIHSQSDISLAEINLKYHPKSELRECIKELKKVKF
jgi:UDP-glucose 4-epimerase